MRTTTPDSGLAISSPEASPGGHFEEDEKVKERYFLSVEDNNQIQVEEEELWRRHPCPICSHVFHSNADYIAHGRIHFQQSLFPSYSPYFYTPFYTPREVFWQTGFTDNVIPPATKTTETSEKNVKKKKVCKRKKSEDKKDGGKRVKYIEKEELDAETLKNLEKCEWERRHGHWCRVCSKRFSSQNELVDHLSYDEEHSKNARSTDRKGISP